MKQLFMALLFSCLTSLVYANGEELLSKGRTAMDAKNYLAAIGYYQELTNLNPTNSDYIRMLGEANGMQASNASMFEALGYALKAKTAFEKAVELDPKNPKAVYALFSYLSTAPSMAGGDMAKARQLASRLETLSPELAKQAKADMRI